MIILDTLIRFSGLGFLIILALLTARDLRGSPSAPYLFLSCISVIAVFLGYTPSFLQLPYYPKMVVRFLDVPHLIFIWLFALSLFQKDFKLRLFHVLVGVIYTTPILLVRLAQYGVFAQFPFWWIVMIDLFSIVLMIHLMFSTLRGRSDDLLEKRRASRVYFVIVIAFVAITSALMEVVMTGELRPYIYTAKIFTFWPAIIFVCFWLFNISPNSIAFVEENRVKSGLDFPNDFSNHKLDARDSALSQKLKTEVKDNKAYLENGLSISILAQRLGITAHRLRALINQTLGHENFSTFVNSYRIEAIKSAFADPANAHIPILTIAMQHGFSSLSPFNRAFRAIEGVTPSEYRQKCLNG